MDTGKCMAFAKNTLNKLQNGSVHVCNLKLKEVRMFR